MLILFLIVCGWSAAQSYSAYQQQPAGILKIASAQWGWFSTAVLIIICLWGVLTIAGIIWKSSTRDHSKEAIISPFRVILLAAFTYLISIGLLVYTTHLRIFLLSWTAPLFFVGAIGLMFTILYWKEKPDVSCLSLPGIILAFSLFLLTQSLLELKIHVPPSIFWQSAYYALMVFNGIFFIGLTLAVMGKVSADMIVRNVIRLRGRIRYILYGVDLVLMVILSWWLFHYDVTGIGSGLFFRLEILMLVSLVIAMSIDRSESKVISVSSFVAAMSLAGYGFMLAAYLVNVTDFPLALGWSEGNRLYDYSLIFGKSLYHVNGELTPNYFSPGRYGLWGLPFLIQGLPIWVHRAWNAFLYCVPGVILGWLLFRDVKNRYWQISGALAVQLFLNQGPVYPSLTIALIIMAAAMRAKPVWRIPAILIASYYAGISRFTWVMVTGAWAGLIDLLLHYPSREGRWLRRLIPTAGYILLGMLPGMAASWLEVFQTQGEMISSQTLLWYRLFPNSTYSLGVVPGLIIATGFAVIFLGYLAFSGKWKPDFWQRAASAVVLVGFIISGLVASAKIGGGSNLHNMDMFLVSLTLILSLALVSYLKVGIQNQPLTGFWKTILFCAVCIPAWSSFWSGGPLIIPDGVSNQKVISEIQAAINEAEGQGEVLFMDQRQLLTFGYIQGVELIPEYEKKYMMDQAMAGNGKYFEEFYKDLKNKRFSLIINETQKVNYQSAKDDFNEENNAWVKWVAEPFLEYYKPLATYKDYGMTLYVPK